MAVGMALGHVALRHGTVVAWSSYREWPGGHDAAYWRAHAGEGLAWLSEHIAR
jgi:hypothetical protein